jgi:glycosyltransferase involved in cell wall biosynthesis
MGLMTIHTLYPAARRPLELGFLSPNNPLDRRSFSGTAFFAARALEQTPGIRLRILGNHRAPRPLDRLLRREKPKITIDQVNTEGLDAVLGLVASPLLDQVMDQTPYLPCFHVTDATPAFLREVYGWNVPGEADAVETRVAARAARVIYSSPQIADRAAGDLGLPGFHAASAPFGVNFDHLPEVCPKKPGFGRLNLMFVGLDWVRKGGDVAVATLDTLLARGINAHLTIVGRCPQAHRSHPHITYAGYLNKNRPRDARKLATLYSNAHLFLLPSRADCTPMVVTEAMAHGTPVLASDTGGIAGQIGGDGTGRVMAPFATPEDWANTIAELTSDPAAYDFMSDAAFERAERHLSWTNWAGRVESSIRTALIPEVHSERDLKAAVRP